VRGFFELNSRATLEPDERWWFATFLCEARRPRQVGRDILGWGSGDWKRPL